MNSGRIFRIDLESRFMSCCCIEPEIKFRLGALFLLGKKVKNLTCCLKNFPVLTQVTDKQGS
jgi:hypothetical protein